MGEDSLGENVAEELTALDGRVEVVGGINKIGITFVVNEAGIISVGEGIVLGSGEVDSVLEIELDGGRFFDFFDSGKVGIGNSVAEGDGIGGDSGGQDDFGLG